MLYKASELIGREVRGSDGDAGSIDDLYFDDERWGVRYLVVGVGGWMAPKKVLLSPSAVPRDGEAGKELRVDLTREQIAGAPDVDTDKPVSRHYEIAHSLYYGYPHYWGGPFLWGAGIYPAVVPMAPREAVPGDGLPPRGEDIAHAEEEAAQKSHLRSVREVVGYHVEASDGTAGMVDDFVIDAATWGIVRIVVDARAWWPGGQVLIGPDAVVSVDWPSRSMRLRISRDAVKASPEP